MSLRVRGLKFVVTDHEAGFDTEVLVPIKMHFLNSLHLWMFFILESVQIGIGTR